MLSLSKKLQSVALICVLAAIALLCLARPVQAQSSCATSANAIVTENCLTGNPSSEWDIQSSGAGDLTIQGFSTDISVTVGGTINFKISTDASAYSINIYRMGYYGGMGARKVAAITPSVTLPQSQPACLTDPATAMTDCGNWAVSASWTVPSNSTSGIYFAHLIRKDTGGDSHIVFVVRNDASSSDILFQTSDPTWVAYNYYGNGSLYGPGTPSFSLPSRTYAVSYNRPLLTRGFGPESNTFVFGAEFPMVQWLEANGYDVSYFSGIDTARYGSLIPHHKIFMDVGHDEYVAGPARASIEAARDAGVNLAFFSGNEVFWKTRLGNSIDPSNTANRSLICYKETLAFAKLDPQDPPTWTGTWRDPSFSPPADGGRPENALTGTLFLVNGTGSDNMGDQVIQVPAADGQMRFWRKTAVANLAPGTSYSLVTGSLGYEWDVDADNGARPAGAFQMSTSTYQFTVDQLLDYGATYGAGTATHHLMMHRAPSGALIFGAGTINWSWGLNSNHDNPFGFSNPDPDINMEQATVNLFADMGVQPAGIQPGLLLASASTDTTPPTSAIVSPAPGSTLTSGGSVSVSGTASDSGGGVVAGVEVSLDGGATWHPAIGRSSWSYSWTPSLVGSATLLSRAVDDSGNLESPITSTSVSVLPQTCPCTIFGSGVPANVDSGDTGAIEVGVKFTADADGSLLGVRFYKSAANTGTHVGHIWSSSGQLLGTATFTGESASGWQQVNFSSPIPVTANTTYVASYSAPVGHYSADSFYFEQAGHNNPPLHALANGVDGQNGVYVYGASGSFPTQSYDASQYWVDVVFSSSNTYAISGSISGLGGAGSVVSLSGPESVSVAADSAGNFVFDGVANGTYTVAPSKPGVTFSPATQSVSVNYSGVTGVAFTALVTNPLSISGTIAGGPGATVTLAGGSAATTIADVNGNYSFTGLLAASYTVTPSEASYIFNPSTIAVTLTSASNTSVNFTGQVCTCVSIFSANAVPSVIDSGDGNSVELGVKFFADTANTLTGIRFYKSAANIGQHIGHLWSISGVLLGTATFPGETASGWQQGYFPSPIQLSANTDYVVSYLAPVGHYSADSNYFAAGVDHPPLHALANGVNGGNGVYFYTASGGFPSGTYNATNYWVDVLYAAQQFSLSGTVTGTAGPGATVILTGAGQATIVADASGNYQFNGLFGGSYDVAPSANGAVFSPGNQPISLSNSNVTNINFAESALCPCNTVWPLSTLPTTADAGDINAIEVGTKIRPDLAGYVIGVRFYKAATNSGQHVGHLWAADGQAAGKLLASGTVTNETPSGWQQVLFANPVPVQALTTYVASYYAPAGHYAGDPNFFTSANVDNPPLHALATGVDGPNGVYNYGATSSYPSSTYQAANYWVDLIYASSTTYSISGTISGIGGASATITLSGAASATVTTDVNGNYSFNGLANGTYTLTPSAPGFVTNPSTQTVAVNGAHDLNINFVAAPPTFVISGTVTGASGTTLALTGSTIQTATVDAFGNYAFSAVPAGSYLVTPSAAGFTFAPGSQTVVVTAAPVANINFAASVLTYSISGAITGAPGATILVSGASSTSTVADSFGNYTVSGLQAGAYTIVPVPGSGVITTPSNLTLSLGNASITGANFAVPSVCPCYTIFQPQAIPAVSDFGDPNATELGVKITVAADAYITGVRFYKAPLNTGVHLGRLWSSSGTLLGSATFVNESSSGWQQVFFSAPIPVTANTTYVVSYFAPAGNYSADVGYFLNSGVSSPPLQALANGLQGPNGVYLALTTGGFPSLSFNSNATNYWVDGIDTPSSTYTITGTIAGAGGPGASVALSGPSSAAVTADASGNFSFSGLADGTYTLTPTESGYAYTPANLQATVNNAHVLGISFGSATATYTLSGVITGAGASGTTVTLSGTSSGTVVTSASGVFSFSGLPNGSYTVVVSNPLYLFTPASQVVTIAAANASLSFSSTAITYSISGAITGPGNSGATVVLSGTASASTHTTASGTYSFTGLANGTYTVAPSLTGYVFTPTSQSVIVSNANGTASFVSAAAAIYSISGTISGTGGPAATVTLSGASSATVTATSTGTFSFTGLTSGNYTVVVAKSGYSFTPASQAITIATANVTTSFSSALNTFTISGTLSGAGASGANVTLSGPSSANTVSNASGAYSFTALSNGSYTVTPSLAGYAFTPLNTSVVISGASKTANFSSTKLTYTVSGTISGPGGPGATVKLTGAAAASTVANSVGAFSFTGLSIGTYTISATRTGYTFSPSSQNLAITTANVTANFSSAVNRYTLSGTLSGAGGGGATVRLSGAAAATTTASANGSYSFTNLLSGTYSVTPSQTGFTFSPTTQNATIASASLTLNFTATALTYNLSGTVTGNGRSGATVTLSGAAARTTTTNIAGTYSFTGLANGSYAVRVTRSGFTFSPAPYNLTIAGANATANFTSR